MLLVYSSYWLNYDPYIPIWGTIFLLLCIWSIHTLAALQYHATPALEKQRLGFMLLNHLCFTWSFLAYTQNAMGNQESPFMSWILVAMSLAIAVILYIIYPYHTVHNHIDHIIQRVHKGMGNLAICYAFICMPIPPQWTSNLLIISAISMHHFLRFRSHHLLIILSYSIITCTSIWALLLVQTERSLLFVGTTTSESLSTTSLLIMTLLMSVMLCIEYKHKKLYPQKGFNLYIAWLTLLVCIVLILGVMLPFTPSTKVSLHGWNLMLLLVPFILLSLINSICTHLLKFFEPAVKVALHLGLNILGFIPIVYTLPYINQSSDQTYILVASALFLIINLSYDLWVVRYKTYLNQTKVLSNTYTPIQCIEYVYGVSFFSIGILTAWIHSIYTWDCVFLSIISIIFMHGYHRFSYSMMSKYLGHFYMVVLVVLIGYHEINPFISLSDHLPILHWSVALLSVSILVFHVLRIQQELHHTLLYHNHTSKPLFTASPILYDLYTACIIYYIIDGLDLLLIHHMTLILSLLSVLMLYSVRVFWVYCFCVTLLIYSGLYQQVTLPAVSDHIIVIVTFLCSLTAHNFLIKKQQNHTDLSHPYWQHHTLTFIVNLFLWGSAIQCVLYMASWVHDDRELIVWIIPIGIYTWIGFKKLITHARYIVWCLLIYCSIQLIPLIWGLPSHFKLSAFFLLGITFIVIGWLYHKKRISADP